MDKEVKAERITTAKKQEVFLECYEKSLIISTACKNANITRDSFYRWMREDEEFIKAVDLVRELRIDYAESRLFKQMDSGNSQATIFFLKTQGKSRGYNEDVNVKLSADTGAQVIFSLPDNKRDDEKS